MTPFSVESSPAVRRILLIKPSSLGDIVHALPVLAGLRRTYPEAHIAWLVGTGFTSLLEGHPLLDEVIPFDRKRYGQMVHRPSIAWEFARFLTALRKRQFDLVIDLQGLVRSGFLALATGARHRVGFADAREFAAAFYTHRIKCGPRDLHAIDKNLHVARTLGLPVDPPEFPLGIRDAELDEARHLLASTLGQVPPAFIAVIPGARWETKRWLPDRTAALITRLQHENFAPIILLGGPDDRTLAAQILKKCPTPPINLVGRTTLPQLAALLSLSSLVICQDSGPMHIAAALKRPLLALFGPTNPDRTGPYSPTARVIALPLDCAPCYRRECPLHHHHCMKQLNVDLVLKRVRDLWSSIAPPEAVTA